MCWWSLVEALSPARSLARNPLFQVMLAFQNLPEDQQPAWQLPGMAATVVPPGTIAPKFDLAITLGERRTAPTGHDVINLPARSRGPGLRVVSESSLLCLQPPPALSSCSL